MERNEFLEKMFNMYSGSFKADNTQTWLDAYKKVLNEDIDYDRLYDTVLEEYTAKTAPTPAWLKQNATYRQTGNTKIRKCIIFKNIYATAPNGYEYCFGYNPEESNYSLEAEALIKKGFTNIREAK